MADMAGAGEIRFIFRAKDYDASVTFYRDGLELPIVGSWDRGPDERGTLFQAASGIIEVLALALAHRSRRNQGDPVLDHQLIAKHPKTPPWTRHSIEMAEKKRIAKGW
jgi:catechol 2,3-dioxygenase-like lactoylglutathione lyase family enzyme